MFYCKVLFFEIRQKQAIYGQTRQIISEIKKET